MLNLLSKDSFYSALKGLKLIFIASALLAISCADDPKKAPKQYFDVIFPCRNGETLNEEAYKSITNLKINLVEVKDNSVIESRTKSLAKDSSNQAERRVLLSNLPDGTANNPIVRVDVYGEDSEKNLIYSGSSASEPINELYSRQSIVIQLAPVDSFFEPAKASYSAENENISVSCRNEIPAFPAKITSVLGDQGRVFFFGGAKYKLDTQNLFGAGSTNVHIIDELSDEIRFFNSRKADFFDSGQKLDKKRAGMISVKYGTKAFLIGGFVENNGDIATSADILEVNTTDGSVSLWPNTLSESRAEFAYIQKGSKVYVFGGKKSSNFKSTGNANAISTIEVIDLNSRTTRLLGELSFPRFGALALRNDDAPTGKHDLVLISGGGVSNSQSNKKTAECDFAGVTRREIDLFDLNKEEIIKASEICGNSVGDILCLKKERVYHQGFSIGNDGDMVFFGGSAGSSSNELSVYDQAGNLTGKREVFKKVSCSISDLSNDQISTIKRDKGRKTTEERGTFETRSDGRVHKLEDGSLLVFGGRSSNLSANTTVEVIKLETCEEKEVNQSKCLGGKKIVIEQIEEDKNAADGMTSFLSNQTLLEDELLMNYGGYNCSRGANGCEQQWTSGSSSSLFNLRKNR